MRFYPVRLIRSIMIVLFFLFLVHLLIIHKDITGDDHHALHPKHRPHHKLRYHNPYHHINNHHNNHKDLAAAAAAPAPAIQPHKKRARPLGDLGTDLEHTETPPHDSMRLGKKHDNRTRADSPTHKSRIVIEKTKRKRKRRRPKRKIFRNGMFGLRGAGRDGSRKGKGKGRRDRPSWRIGAQKGHGVKAGSARRSGRERDPYAGVTFPPYVERLPKGAEGTAHKGLQIRKSDLSPEQQALYDQQWKLHHFNQYVSDRLPVRRPLPDYRSQQCQKQLYGRQLGRLSVVMVFHNEAWSVLLRSVHSVLLTTPPHLLLHVILVDDFSSMEHLKRPLDKYFHRHPKVRVFHSPHREGLIRARLRGFNATAGADVVVFLDSHIECTKGWAEPMLWTIKKNPRSVVFPTIDYIIPGDFSYLNNEASPHGIFGLNTFTFRWALALRRPRLPQTEPMPSPTMPGGLFAISRDWFLKLGTFDPQLLFWGGENLELSFKAWMCGGQVVAAQCSHVGHIYRASPLTWAYPLGPRNNVRVALVWMDSYKNHYLERIHYRLGDYGDISDRVALRKRLQCRSFEWYIDHVYPELRDQIVVNATHAGQFKHVESGQCLDKMDPHRDNPSLYHCHMQGGSQFWYLRDERFIQMEEVYLCKSRGGNSIAVCEQKDREEWAYEPKTGHLKHVKSGHCLQNEDDHSDQLVLHPCSSSRKQVWSLQLRKPFQNT